MFVRDNDAGTTESGFDLFHVLDSIIGTVSCLLQLILMLIENDRTTVCDLVGGDDLSSLLDPGIPSVIVGACAGARATHLTIRCP